MPRSPSRARHFRSGFRETHNVSAETPWLPRRLPLARDEGVTNDCLFHSALSGWRSARVNTTKCCGLSDKLSCARSAGCGSHRSGFVCRWNMAEVTQAVEPPVPGPSKPMEYDAFLSYAHRDQEVASAIQRSLHRIGRRVGQLRALRVFRDTTNLEANPDLWAKITDALNASRYLIVVLSPQAAASHWVNEEVSYWLEHCRREHLMFVLAEGHLEWDQLGVRFDSGHSDAAPPVLTEQAALPAEPLYIDVSDDAPWDFRSPTFRDKVTALAAPIHGKPKDQLTSDDLREQRRFRRLRRAAVAGLVVLTVIAVVAALVAVAKQREAIRQRDMATALKLTSQGQAILAGVQGGGDVRALQEILAAPRIAPSTDTGALFTGVVERRDTLKIIPTAGSVLSVAFSPDGHRWPPPAPTTRAVVGRRHRPTPRRPAHRPHRRGDQCGVQPRRAPLASGSDDSTRAAVGRRHRPTHRRPAHRPHRRGEQCGVQPRRAPPGLRQRRRHRAVVGRRHRPTTRRTRSPATPAAVNSVAFSPDGHRSPPAAATRPAAVERRHRPTPRRPAHRPHRRGERVWRSVPTGTAGLRQRRSARAVVGRRHRPTHGAPLTGHTDRVYQRGVQPRRAPHGLRQRRSHAPVVGRRHRPTPGCTR